MPLERSNIYDRLNEAGLQAQEGVRVDLISSLPGRSPEGRVQWAWLVSFATQEGVWHVVDPLQGRHHLLMPGDSLVEIRQKALALPLHAPATLACSVSEQGRLELAHGPQLSAQSVYAAVKAPDEPFARELAVRLDAGSTEILALRQQNPLSERLAALLACVDEGKKIVTVGVGVVPGWSS